MEQTKTKMKLWKRILIGITATVLAVVLVLGVAVFAIWHNEIAAIASMKLVRERNDDHLDGAVYTMTVKGDFYLDEFVEQGGVDFSKPVMLGYSGLSDALLLKYIEDSKHIWEGNIQEVRYTTIGSVIGTHAGPGAVVVAFFKK